MPKGVTWIRQAAVGADPETRTVALDDGSTVEYDKLVMCPGIQLDWEKITGLRQTLGRDGVSSNYLYELAPATWRFIRELRSGTAVFTMPSGPIKCAGAPQKIAHLAADYWREQGVLDKIDIHLVLPTPGMFGVKVFADVLEQTARRYGITVHFESEAVAVSSPRAPFPAHGTSRSRSCPSGSARSRRTAPWSPTAPLATAPASQPRCCAGQATPTSPTCSAGTAPGPLAQPVG